MKKTASRVLQLIGELRNETPSDTQPAGGEWTIPHTGTVENLIEKRLPIHMVLPAFPAKSPNAKKTSGYRPDYGEVLALIRLNDLCRRISEVYPGGARITICSDGRVFSDVVGVSDDLVHFYGQEIQLIIQEQGLENLDLFRLEDVYAGSDFDRMRRRLMEQFGEELGSLKSRVRTEIEARSLFNGMHRFMYEDQSDLLSGHSRNQIREKSKDLAYEVIRRSNAWSRLVEGQFPEALRLSIHPQSALSKKIGIRLLPSNDIWRTPWHAVTVFDGRGFYLAPRSEVERAGGILRYMADRYAYYALDEARIIRAVAP